MISISKTLCSHLAEQKEAMFPTSRLYKIYRTWSSWRRGRYQNIRRSCVRSRGINLRILSFFPQNCFFTKKDANGYWVFNVGGFDGRETTAKQYACGWNTVKNRAESQPGMEKTNMETLQSLQSGCPQQKDKEWGIREFSEQPLVPDWRNTTKNVTAYKENSHKPQPRSLLIRTGYDREIEWSP